MCRIYTLLVNIKRWITNNLSEDIYRIGVCERWQNGLPSSTARARTLQCRPMEALLGYVSRLLEATNSPDHLNMSAQPAQAPSWLTDFLVHLFFLSSPMGTLKKKNYGPTT